MGKEEKLYRKAKNSPNNTSFDDICSLAECVGCEYRNTKGSHKTYDRPDGKLMNFQSVNGKAKPYQVRQLLEYIEHNGLIKEEG